MRALGRRRVSQRGTGAHCLGSLVQKIGQQCHPQRESPKAGITHCQESLGRKTGASLCLQEMENRSIMVKGSRCQLRCCQGGIQCPPNPAILEGALTNRYSTLSLKSENFSALFGSSERQFLSVRRLTELSCPLSR